MATTIAPGPGSPVPAERRRGPGGRRGRLMKPGWPLTIVLLGYPVFWVLGIGIFVFPLVGLIAGAQLLFRRNLHAPKGFGIWLLYLAWVVASLSQLDHVGSVFPIYRFINYLSVTGLFLWVYNSDPEDFPTRRAVGLLASFWLITVAGGWLGVLVPHGEFTSPAEKLLPASLLTGAFEQMVHPAFAQVQDFLGYPLGRPKAPFAYTNDWGAVYALLAPFFFYGWLQASELVRRRRALIILALSLIPVFISLNRGLWLGLGVALLNAATRPGDVARAARRVLAVLLTLGLAILLFTPLSSVVEQRAATGHSNQGRSYLYTETIDKANQAPILGYGNTIKVASVDSKKILPAIGTQGHFWTVLISQGWIGALIFEAFLLKMWFSTRKRGPTVTFWAHATITVAIVVQFTYDWMPVELHLIFFAMALGLRDAHRVDASAPDGAAGEPTEAHPAPPWSRAARRGDQTSRTL